MDDVTKSPGAIVFGADLHSFLTQRPVFSSGRTYRSAQEVIVGDEFAQQLHLVTGAGLTVAHHQRRVVGIYHIGVAAQD